MGRECIGVRAIRLGPRRCLAWAPGESRPRLSRSWFWGGVGSGVGSCQQWYTTRHIGVVLYIYHVPEMDTNNTKPDVPHTDALGVRNNQSAQKCTF